MSHNLQKSVLITGCSKGIGLCAARELQNKGYRVFATARKEIDVAWLKKEGFESELLDLANQHSIDTALSNILQKTEGCIDYLLNNAGNLVAGPVESIEMSLLKDQFETNFFGVTYLTQKVLAVMQKQAQGRIIFISSMNAILSAPYVGAYAASKFALEGLVESLAMELYNSPIQVVLIQPGIIATDLRRSFIYSPLAEKDKNSPYESWLSFMSASTEKEALPMMQPPSVVVKKIIQAMETKSPKFRYRVTLLAHLQYFVRSFFSSRVQIRFMAKIANIKQ